MTNAELITLLKEAREYVEAFAVAGADSTSSIASFKVDLPKDGFPRQWAVEAAPETLAHIDAVLAKHQPKIEWQWAEGGWCEETAASLRVEHNYNAGCWAWSVSGNASTEDEARRIASEAARNAK